MSLCDEIMAVLPELTLDDFIPSSGSICVFNDGDGVEYISKWDYSKPIPKGFKLGK